MPARLGDAWLAFGFEAFSSTLNAATGVNWILWGIITSGFSPTTHYRGTSPNLMKGWLAGCWNSGLLASSCQCMATTVPPCRSVDIRALSYPHVAVLGGGSCDLTSSGKPVCSPGLETLDPKVDRSRLIGKTTKTPTWGHLGLLRVWGLGGVLLRELLPTMTLWLYDHLQLLTGGHSGSAGSTIQEPQRGLWMQVCRSPHELQSGHITDSRAIWRVDRGLYIRITLWPLPTSSCKIHVLLVNQWYWP